MSNAAGPIDPLGPFQGSPQGPPDLRNRTSTPAKESAANPTVSADAVELNDVQRQAQAAAAAGRALIALDPEAQLLMRQAQAMVAEGRVVQGKVAREMQDEREMVEYLMRKEESHRIANQNAREADRKKGKFQTEEHRGLVDGKNIEKGGEASSAGDGSSGGSGNG